MKVCDRKSRYERCMKEKCVYCIVSSEILAGVTNIVIWRRWSQYLVYDWHVYMYCMHNTSRIKNHVQSKKSMLVTSRPSRTAHYPTYKHVGVIPGQCPYQADTKCLLGDEYMYREEITNLIEKETQDLPADPALKNTYITNHWQWWITFHISYGFYEEIPSDGSHI